MQKRLSEIKERLERATPGPWFVAEQPFDDRSTAIYGDNKAPVSIDPHGARFITDCDVTMEWTEGEPDQSVFDRANARFIANAPTDIAYLLAMVERAREALEACAGCLTISRFDLKTEQIIDEKLETPETIKAREALADLEKLAGE